MRNRIKILESRIKKVASHSKRVLLTPVLILYSVFYILPTKSALADEPSSVKLDLKDIKLLDPSGGAALQTTLTNLIFAFLAAAAFIGIVYSGFMMITAGGDATKFAAGRKNLLWAIIGIIIVVVSYFIITFIYRLAGNLIGVPGS